MAWQIELQKAIFGALTGAVIIDGQPVPVFDDVPQDADCPYITIGHMSAIDWSTDTEIGNEADVTIHAWSRYRGNLEVYSMQDQIKAALNRQELAVTGWQFTGIDYTAANVLRDPDGITRHGVQTFTVRVSA